MNGSTHFFQGNLRGKTFALWGLAFKPNTDDMRHAPSRVLLEALWAAGASVRAFDPEAMQQTQSLYPDEAKLLLMGTPESVLPGADALIICTEWQQFKAPDFELIKQRLNAPVIFDGRNLYDAERLARTGFQYFAMGRRCFRPPMVNRMRIIQRFRRCSSGCCRCRSAL